MLWYSTLTLLLHIIGRPALPLGMILLFVMLFDLCSDVF